MSVDIDRLFHPAYLSLPSTTGQSVSLEAEQSLTTGTTQSAGSGGTINVTPTLIAAPCDSSSFKSCSTTGTSSPNRSGFYLTSKSGTGVQSGTSSYQIDVPATGSYSLSYRVRTPAGVSTAVIQLVSPNGSVNSPVNTGGSWSNVAGGSITLTSGRQTVTLGPPSGGAGWELDKLTLTKT
jgi:hypothetical protein